MDGSASGALRVFLSHTSELAVYPPDRSFVAAAKSAVERMRWAAVEMTAWAPVDAPAAHLCAEEVRGCQVYVGILGFRHGALVRDDPSRSHVELEFEEAGRAGIPRLVFLVGDAFAAPRRFFDQPEDARERQLAFRARVDAVGLVRATVDSPGALEMLLYQALAEQQGRHRTALGHTVVGEIPARPLAFVDRIQVADVEAALEAGDRVVAVCALTGGRGVGKTQVAAEVARRAAATGWPVVAWVSGETRDQLVADLAFVAEALDVADPEGDSLRSARRLRQALQSRSERALLIVDNAVDPDDLVDVLPTVGPTRVVITSVDRAFASHAMPVNVSVYAREESIAYLRQRTGRGDDVGAAGVAEEVGDSPLGLAQAAAVLATRPGLAYAEFAARLRDRPLARTLLAEAGAGYPRGIAEAVLQATAAAESADTSGRVSVALQLLSVLAPDGLDPELAAVLLGDDVADVEDILAALARLSLLDWTANGRGVVVHRLTARVIRDSAAADGSLSSLLAETAQALRRVLPDAAAWDHRASGVALVDHAMRLWRLTVSLGDAHAPTAQVVDVAHWAVQHLTGTADFHRAADVGAIVLADCERVFGPDHPATLASRSNLAGAYRSSGDLRRAVPLFEATLADAERVLGRDHPSTLASRNNLAGAYHRVGSPGTELEFAL